MKKPAYETADQGGNWYGDQPCQQNFFCDGPVDGLRRIAGAYAHHGGGHYLRCADGKSSDVGEHDDENRRQLRGKGILYVDFADIHAYGFDHIVAAGHGADSEGAGGG